MIIEHGAIAPSFARTANLPTPKHEQRGPAPLRNRALHARERVEPCSENLDVELSDLLHAARMSEPELKLDLPLLQLEVAPGKIAGEYRAAVSGSRTLYIRVPDNAAKLLPY